VGESQAELIPHFSAIIMSQKTILIIEADDSLRQLLSHILKKTYEVISMKSGKEAIHWLAEGRIPDVVLMESILRGMTAGEIVEYLRVSGIYRETPILLLAGRTEENAGRQLMLSGANALLAKPFNPEELHQQLHALIQSVG
jgi:CheY-like chemotaxis protein